jgi:hypothetical protein
MEYKPLIVIDDDQPEQLKLFKYKSVDSNVNVEIFESWDLTKQYIELNQPNIDGIILDARGKINIDKGASDAHVLESFGFVQGLDIPYAIYTAYTAELPILEEQVAKGRVFTKGTDKEEDVFEFLKEEIKKSPKLKIIKKYPEPFQCFGGIYLEKNYETLLLNIIKVFEDDSIDNPENILFNPCRVILEQVFKKINEVNERILPYALINFDNQKVGLINCSKYLNGQKVNIRIWDGRMNTTEEYRANKVLLDHISQQIQTIIAVCHPASHEIQRSFSRYTFKSVLWALFDVLIWLKEFVDKES